MECESKKVEHDIRVIKDLELNNNEKNISNFIPTTSSINITDLKKLDEKLNPLKSREKRQLRNLNGHGMMDEMPMNDRLQYDEMSMDEANTEVQSTMQSINIPNTKGNPSFSIHANTVYILYPSVLQDPNIFGRLSIPQNVNLDRQKENLLNQPDQPPPMSSRRYNFQGNSNNLESFRKRRNVPIIPLQRQGYEKSNDEMMTNPQRKDQQGKGKVESNLTGTIVVLNQDVIEQNTKPSY
ncbi:unnamed protein product [Chironomus riparius]|uniref:Uncharacterized protein n=1 Tax=Chironomus riparius TaxID=315576 RepID=A0A9N9RWG4_9DIPT|nr:unnamed protein product [Chironomus riparius]